MTIKKRLMPVSKDNGKTWKKRWIPTYEFDPEKQILKVGDLVKVGEAIHSVVIRNGKVDCPLVKCEDDNHDWENETWHKQCRKCTYRITWKL
jgi:hypothetical protein